MAQRFEHLGQHGIRDRVAHQGARFHVSGVEHIGDGLTAGGASAAIISSILYSPRFDRNVGVRELKDGLAELGVAMRPYLDA